MSLQSIRADIASDFGIDLTNPNELSWLNAKINERAQELLGTTDLVGSLREQLFIFPGTETEVSLPWYVLAIRGIRRPCLDRRDPIQFGDLAPRYQYNSWGAVSPWRMRVRGEVPIARNMDALVPIRASIPAAVDYDIVLTVTAQTQHATRNVEEQTIPAGQTSVTFTAVPFSIKSLFKDRVTDADVTFYTTDDNTLPLAVIPNNRLYSKYLRLQIRDICCSCTFQGCEHYAVEVLYKSEFEPMVHDTDEFLGGRYDTVIKLFYTAYEDKSSDIRAEAKVRAARMIQEIAEDAGRGQTVTMNVKRNQYLTAYDRTTYPYFRGTVYGT